MTISIVLAALFVLFLAAFVKSILGFGEALVGMSLLTLVVGVQTAAPLVGLVASSTTLLILVKDWRHLDLKAVWRLVVAAAFGVPLGAWGLKNLPEAVTTVALGVFLIIMGIYYLTEPTIKPLHNESWGYVFGFVAGMLGGAYTIAGPPVIIYATTQKWSALRFRVTLQGFFLSIYVFILISHATSGLWTSDIIRLYFAALPLTFIAFITGDRISQRLDPKSFQKLVYFAIIVLGGLLLL